MIYFFDINLKLKKIVNPDNALSAIHEHELNNHIIGSMVMDMSYAKRFIDDVDHFGYYYKGNFYLHRIRRVEDSHINETVTVTGRHIFFEDMLYGLPIDDFRPQNRDAAYILKNTIDTNTRWRTVMTDVTGTLSTNFYRQVPWDVIEWVTENFRVEFEPVILFDGQKINGYQLHVANKLGVNKHKRIPFSRVTELDYEIDYSEIITSLAGYGKGEEVGDGHGRRINIADVDFSRNGVVSPIGSHYMEDENITAIYGKDNGEPKYGIVEFSDIEDDELLAEAMYESYLEMSRPKMAFSASVIDVGDVGIGDTQVIVRPEYDVFYSVRIHKMVVNLHDPEDADVELGDYEHFKESKVERKSRKADKEWKKRYASAIQELKRDWDADYNGIVEQIEQGYEQAVIDANANIQASEVRMQDELDTQRQQMTENIDTAKQNAIDTATQNAEEKADAVQSNLNAFETEHQRLYDEVTGDIMDIDTFLGDLTIPLNKQFENMETGLNQSITAVDGRIDAMVTNFGDSGKSLSQFVIDVEGIEQTVAANDEWLGTHGSNVLQTVEGFEQKVWQADIVNPNMLSHTDITKSKNFDEWELIRANAHWVLNNEWLRVRAVGSTAQSYFGVYSPYFKLIEGEEYTVSFEAFVHSGNNAAQNMNYVYMTGEDFANIGLVSGMSSQSVSSVAGTTTYRYQTTFVATTDTELAQLLIGTRVLENGTTAAFYIKEPKIEMGERATPYKSSFSALEQRADDLSLRVANLSSLDGEEIITQSDIVINPDNIRIGSRIIGDAEFASIFSVSPQSIDVITENLNLTGNLNVKGQIESLSVDAVTADFAEIFADIADIGFIKGKHIDAGSITVDKLYGADAILEYLMARTVFADEVKTMSIEAVYADLRSVNSEIMTSNIIKSNWLDVDTALIDRLITTDFFAENATIKAANVRDLEAITIDAVQANLTTVMNSMGEVEGGLTIRRPDGAVMVQNGMPRFEVPLDFREYIDDSVEYNGKDYTTNARGTQLFGVAYGSHQGRYLRFSFGLSMGWNAVSASTHMEVVIRPANAPSGTDFTTLIEQFIVYRNEPTDWRTLVVDLGVPTYGAMSFQLEFYRVGENVENPVSIRPGRIWVAG